MTRSWLREDLFELCRCVKSTVKADVAPDVSALDYEVREGGRRELVAALYAALRKKRLNYELEPAHSTIKIQQIREADEVLKAKEGTCLDLALLFCGVCLDCELLPVLVILEGHALVAVPLNSTQRERRRPVELKLFENVLVKDAAKGEQLIEWIRKEAYLAVECTGFAVGKSLGLLGDKPECCGREVDGTMTFERAVEAGKQQFEPGRGREFQFALDLATWQQIKRSARPEEEERTSDNYSHAGMREGAPPADPLPSLLDRGEQEEALRDAIFIHRESKPQRPLVCIVHGNVDEYHTAFLNRLEDSLPSILGLWHPEEAAQFPVERHKLNINLSKVTADNYVEVFWDALKMKLFGNKSASREDVVNFISRLRLAVMIELSLLSEQLEGPALGALDLFLKFWDGWDKLPDKPLFMVCLGLKYQPNYEPKLKFGFWRTYGLNDDIRRFVSEMSFSTYQNLGGICLPELLSIKQTDALEVIERPPVRERYRVDEVDVGTMYANAPIQGIPMMPLLEMFRRFLKVTT